MIWSSYQKAIFDAIQFTTKNIVVRATAGSAKTTSIVEGAKKIPYGKKALFVAFNRHTVADLRSRLPETVDCATLHSVGCKAIYAAYDEVTISDNKQIKFIEPIFERVKDYREKWRKIYETDQLLSLVRATMTELNYEAIKLLGDRYALYPDDEIIYATVTSGIRFNSSTFDESKRKVNIDFQDMISLAANAKWIRIPQYDYVFLDEAQDCSRQDQLLIERMLKPVKGRLIAVGDGNQSCYFFRGSDINSFNYFETRPNTVSLPLTISYRCAKNIVSHAKNIYSEIEPWEESPDGIVKTKGGVVDDIQNGDFVLARNLRPLVDVFLQLIAVDKKSTIIGKEFEKGLLTLLHGIPDEKSIADLEVYFNDMISGVKSRLSKQGFKNVNDHPKVEIIEEKVNVLKKLSERCGDVGELITLIMSIFSDDDVAPIKLSTIHKAKGKEANRVFIIDTYEGKKLIPNKYAVTKEMLIQEKNLSFVASTRAKRELIYLNL